MQAKRVCWILLLQTFREKETDDLAILVGENGSGVVGARASGHRWVNRVAVVFGLEVFGGDLQILDGGTRLHDTRFEHDDVGHRDRKGGKDGNDHNDDQEFDQREGMAQ